MYLFMVVLQVCIFFPQIHFGSRGYSLGLLSCQFFPTPPPNLLYGNFTHLLTFQVAFNFRFHTNQCRLYVQISTLLIGTISVVPSDFILQRGIVCHLKYILVFVKMTSINPEKFPANEENSKIKWSAKWVNWIKDVYIFILCVCIYVCIYIYTFAW